MPAMTDVCRLDKYLFLKRDDINSLLPGHKLEWLIITTAHPIPGHERVNEL